MCCHCRDGWICEEHPDRPWPHDGCKALGDLCCKRWMFQDVHAGGVAAAAGIQSGDVLIAVNDEEMIPPAATPFRLGQSYTLTVRKRDGSTMRPTLEIPGSREKQRPIVVPDQVVSARKLDGDVGYVRVSMFPGVLGIDVARDISRAISDLACSRLVVDLRGNTWLQSERHRRGTHLPSLPLVRAVITEILTAHFFVTRPHYLKTMQKLAEIDLRI